MRLICWLFPVMLLCICNDPKANAQELHFGSPYNLTVTIPESRQIKLDTTLYNIGRKETHLFSCIFKKQHKDHFTDITLFVSDIDSLTINWYNAHAGPAITNKNERQLQQTIHKWLAENMNWQPDFAVHWYIGTRNDGNDYGKHVETDIELLFIRYGRLYLLRSRTDGDDHERYFPILFAIARSMKFEG